MNIKKPLKNWQRLLNASQFCRFSSVFIFICPTTEETNGYIMHADIMITEEGDKESANIVLNTENYIQEEIY